MRSAAIHTTQSLFSYAGVVPEIHVSFVHLIQNICVCSTLPDNMKYVSSIQCTVWNLSFYCPMLLNIQLQNSGTWICKIAANEVIRFQSLIMLQLAWISFYSNLQTFLYDKCDWKRLDHCIPCLQKLLTWIGLSWYCLQDSAGPFILFAALHNSVSGTPTALSLDQKQTYSSLLFLLPS